VFCRSYIRRCSVVATSDGVLVQLHPTTDCLNKSPCIYIDKIRKKVDMLSCVFSYEVKNVMIEEINVVLIQS